MKSTFNTILAGLALGTTALLAIGCANGHDREITYTAHNNERTYQTDLFTEPVSGIHQYQRGHTARVEGHSPLTSDIFMLNADQKAAIAQLKQMREERAKAAF